MCFDIESMLLISKLTKHSTMGNDEIMLIG